ncbi:MAG: RNA polymerase sigma factor, partial [Gemmobacter sp.]
EVLDALRGRAGNPPFLAAGAFVVGGAGRRDVARAAYARAIAMAPTDADARLLGLRRRAGAT